MGEMEVLYEAPFGTGVDEERVQERIDAAWMRDTAPSEYEKASGEQSDYLGCTYKEATLRDIHPRAMAWFCREGGDAERVSDGMGTGNERFDGDLTSFFANVQASAYCKALQDGMGGEKAMEEASEALYMVSEPYREWLSGWNDDIEAD